MIIMKNILKKLHIKLGFSLWIKHFFLIPSTILIFAFYVDYINEINKEIINYYFFPLGLLSLFIYIFSTALFKLLNENAEILKDKN